jgi:diguanylate cyclase (GGDEF)-like protein/PAS domain S-box-containing protein
LLLGALGLTAYTLGVMRKDAILYGLETSALLAQNFEDQLTSSIRATELAVIHLADSKSKTADWSQVQNNFVIALRGAPHVRSMSLLDESNRIIVSTNPDNLGLRVATDSYFPIIAGKQSALQIGLPWFGRDFSDAAPTNQQSAGNAPQSFVPVTQTVTVGGRQLLLLVALNPDYFVLHMLSRIEGKNGSASILRLDGTLLMDTDPASPIGSVRSFPDHPFHFNEVESHKFEINQGQGRYGLAAYSVSRLYPFAVVTVIDRDFALRNWSYEMKTVVGIVGPALLALTVLVFAFHRRQHALEEQRAKSARLEQVNAARVFSNSKEGILITSVDATIIDVNSAFEQISGYSRDEVIGRNPRMLRSGHHDHAFYKELWSHLLGQGFWRGEIRNRHKSGQVYVEEIVISAVRDEQGAIHQFVGQFSDVSERKQTEERVRQLAFFDPLTHLHNRRLLEDRLRQNMVASKRDNFYCSVIFLDLDNFKPLNDLHGHAVGDLLLQEVGNRLLACVREIDTVARIGGDEFVVVLGKLNTDLTKATQEAMDLAEKVKTDLAAPYFLAANSTITGAETIEHRCSASVGLVMCKADELSLAEILKRADFAMYKAKEAGRNKVVLFDHFDGNLSP